MSRYPAPNETSRADLARELRRVYDAEFHDECLLAAAHQVEGKDPRDGWWNDTQFPFYVFVAGESAAARLFESLAAVIEQDKRPAVVELARQARDAIAYDVLRAAELADTVDAPEPEWDPEGVPHATGMVERLAGGTVSFPAINHSLLSPSGRVSKRARAAALKVEHDRLFPPGFWDAPKPDPEEVRARKIATLMDSARNLRELAARGMSARRFMKRAKALEAEARAL